MNAIIRYLVIPLLCQGLVCGVAEAKKDKNDRNSSANKRQQVQQGNSNRRAASLNQANAQRKAAQARQQQMRKARAARGGSRPAATHKRVNRTNPKPKAKKAATNKKKAANQSANRSANKATQRTQKKLNKLTGGKKSAGGNKNQAKKSASNKQGKATAKKKGSGAKATAKRQGSGGKASNKMPLPGKRPKAGANKAGGKNSQANKKVAANRKANNKPKATANKNAKNARNATAKKTAKTRKNQRMNLPGKRPKAKAAKGRSEVDRRAANRRRELRAKSRTRIEQPRTRGVRRPGQNTRQMRRAEFRGNRAWYASGRRGYRNVRVNNFNYINTNFRRGANWSTSRRCWGYNPWWYRSRVRPWYGSCWNYGWRPSYYRYHYPYHRRYWPPGYSRVNVSAAVGWGLLGWSLGTMVYDYGYRPYYNPYRVHTKVVYRDRVIDYTQPINTVAVDTAPEDDEVVADMTEESESHVERSQEAFRDGNYLVALEQVDQAISVSPGDGALHEYRALVFFALGKYGEAAGVLNPVLASGPGWDWSTMVALYPSQDVYTDQLQRLESYSEAKPDAADAHFLLGYHYMVCGHLDLAAPQFDLAAELMPADNVSKELASLTRSSDEDAADEETVPLDDGEDAGESGEEPEPEPVPLEKLTGSWTSQAQGGGTITLTFRDDGTFTWSYTDKNGATKEFKGEYSSNDDGLLVLDSSDSQMVAEVLIPEDEQMNFMLVGGPPDDPGLDFTRG